jgi:hypothetical protein
MKLFEELRVAYEETDEEKALALKTEIDALKESIIKREQKREEKVREVQTKELNTHTNSSPLFSLISLSSLD